jgi:superfamily II DNA/RNA helicase
MQNTNYNLENILANFKIKELNPMQNACLDLATTKNEIVLLSNTGSGKTLAFLLPIIQRIDPTLKTTSALIITPTRELALQIETVFKQMQTGFKITCCYGGHKREIEEQNLVEAPAILVGTPGRLADHIRRRSITTVSINTLVIDEFDKCLELGFLQEVSFVVGTLRNLTHKMLTSATEAVPIPEFMEMEKAERINFIEARPETGITLEIKKVISPTKDKADTLFRMICELDAKLTIVFCNLRETVKQIADMLNENEITAVFYHGAMEQKDRDVALCKFRNGSSNILITTDLASRGLDIPHIRYVIHYDLPPTEDIFTHRNGRTARMHSSGTAILLQGPGEYTPKFLAENITEIEIPKSYTLPTVPEWTTLFINAGKKDKINKIDIVGFLTQRGKLRAEDVGLIEVKDFMAFVAIRALKVKDTLRLIREEKLKGKKIRIEVAY